MITADRQPIPVTLTPNLAADDPLANYWLRQAMVRLRREICWRWRDRAGASAPDASALPPPIDRLSASLDLSRHWEMKLHFFESDATASYLSLLLRDEPPRVESQSRGSFGWVASALELDDVSAFVLALALLSALGIVIFFALSWLEWTLLHKWHESAVKKAG